MALRTGSGRVLLFDSLLQVGGQRKGAGMKLRSVVAALDASRLPALAQLGQACLSCGW